MKRYLTIISIISSISLIGIIYIQLSWLKINIDQQQTYLNQKLIKILRNVGEKISEEIIKNAYSSFIPKDQSIENKKLNFIDNQLYGQSVIYSFNAKQISTLFREEFQKEGIKELSYNFAVIRNKDIIISSAKNNNTFYTNFKDTILFKNYGYPINYKLQGKTLGDINSIEVLYINVKNNKVYIIKKLSYSIGFMLFFTSLLVAAIYISISFILKREQIEIMKSNFIDNMTHEFKTPIATISIALSSLKNKETLADSETVLSFVNIIKEENNRMLEMVELILKNALLSKGELRIDMIPTSLNDIIRNSIRKHNLLLIEKGADIQYQLSAKNNLIFADATQLKIAISNIIENAIKYSKERLTIKIETRNTPTEIILYIEDNGIGMNEDTLKHIFKKFYRANTSNQHNVKGFGLGLNYTKSIIEIHKGNIQVNSTFNRGTKFIITLPLMPIKHKPNNV